MQEFTTSQSQLSFHYWQVSLVLASRACSLCKCTGPEFRKASPWLNAVLKFLIIWGLRWPTPVEERGRKWHWTERSWAAMQSSMLALANPTESSGTKITLCGCFKLGQGQIFLPLCWSLDVECPRKGAWSQVRRLSSSGRYLEGGWHLKSDASQCTLRGS